MPRGISRLLVIDASVARAAGASEHPVSSTTRQFLEAVLDVSHQMVFTPPILDEWRRHQSKFAKRWRVSMHARRKIRMLGAQEDASLRSRILGPAVTGTLREIRLKDIPLVEAALRTDSVIVSRDEEARDAFQLRELSAIVWVNPVRDSGRMRSWLEEGARPVEEWKLGGYDGGQ